jgi:RND family efflux transporter MFP subunit
MSIFKKATEWLSKINKRTWWVVTAVVLLVGAGGYAYYALVYVPSQATVTTTAAMQTAVVRQGNLIIYASGNGTLVAASQASFGFGASGQITKVNAKVGDVVQAGDVLAEMDNSTQQIQYTQAKRALAEMTSPYAIAVAEQGVATALQSVDTARGTLAYLLSPTILYWEEQINQADLDLAKAKAEAKKNPSAEADAAVKKAEGLLDFNKDKLKGNQDYYEKVYLPQYFTARDRDTGAKYLAAPSDAEIANARAVLAEAKATVIESQNYLAALNGKAVPEGATGASLTALEDAQLALKSAEETLAGTQLIAPISGTLMTFDFTVGNKIDTATLATIADLSQPTIETYLDPSDWNNVKVGKDAEITFDALPDAKFTGKVTEVDPGLYTSGNTSVVRALIQLDIPKTGFDLPLGSTASVDVIGGRADNALLVPIEALHAAGDQFTVFVMENSKPNLRIVEVGIQDQVSAEIKSGVQAGDVVTTGIAETKTQ